MSEESDMEKAIKVRGRAAGICFRMVYSTWRVGMYPSLPICLKSTFWKSADTKPVLCRIGCPYFSVCSPPFLFPLLSPRKH
uniref:MAPK activated protein kinase 5 n=1 Tax=Rhinopithecus roxellana TaxID=61622 RepID=A0A2K6P5A8_RHIRO